MSLTGINHLAFITNDMEGTIRFYRDLLGMELTAGIGHDGYRHYFFKFGNNHVAFFEYDGASPMERKFHGERTSKPLGFDHVAFTVDNRQDLFHWLDKLVAAGFDVHGPVDHGAVWSIYFFDPNNIPLEVSWDCVELIDTPAVIDDKPMAIVAEGAHAQPGHWPEVANPTAPEDMIAPHSGNGYAMRENMIKKGLGRPKPDLEHALSTAAAKAAAE